MRVLVLTDRFPPHDTGGAEKSTFGIARGLVEAGCRVSVLSWAPSRDQVGVAEAWGMRIHRFWSEYDERFRAYHTVVHAPALRALERVLATERPDIVQAHHISNAISYWALRRASRAGIPVVLTAHDPGIVCHQKMICGVDLASEGKRLSYEARPGKCAPCMRLRWFPLRNRILARIVARHVAHRFAVSGELARILETNGLGAWEVLYNPFLTELGRAPDAAVTAFRRRFGLDPGVAVIGGGGRVGFWKGTDHLVRAAGELAASGGPPFRLVVCGRVDDGYAGRLLALARESGIEDRFVSTGWIEGDELAAFYAIADVVAVPSIIPDALPRLAIEASGAGVAVVGSPFGGTPEILQDGVTGLIANPLVPGEFARALGRVLGDREQARRMGQRGREFVADRFAVEKNVARRLAVYEALLSEVPDLPPRRKGPDRTR